MLRRAISEYLLLNILPVTRYGRFGLRLCNEYGIHVNGERPGSWAKRSLELRSAAEEEKEKVVTTRSKLYCTKSAKWPLMILISLMTICEK